MEKITQKEVAEKSGVSLATVSLVLNERKDVKISEQTRKRVLEAANEVGYHLKNKRVITGNIGLILRRNVSHFFGDPYYRELFAHIQKSLNEKGYNILFSGREEDLLEGDYSLPEAVLRRKIDGLILLGNIPDFFLKKPKDFGIPLVLVNYASSLDIDSIWFDNQEATKRIMEHLLNLGHKKILFLHGREGSVNFDLRYQTYCSILKKNSLEPLVLKTGGEDSETAYRKAKTFLPLHKEITAIFGGNDGNALGALRAVKELGLNVPKDISLIGFDDIPEAGKSEPPLTTLHIPIEEMGRLGVETLLKRIENQNKDLPVKIFLPTRLIIRQSTVSDADEKITKKVAQEKRVAEIKRITDPHLK